MRCQYMTMVDMSRVEIKQEPYPVLKCTVLFIHLKRNSDPKIGTVYFDLIPWLHCITESTCKQWKGLTMDL